MIKCVIFDLDGTLADTLHTIAFFGNEALKANGFGTIEEDRYRQIIGEGATALVRDMLIEVGAPADAYDAVADKYAELYKAEYLLTTKAFDGVKEVLAFLKGKGVKIGILSNKPHEITVSVADSLFGENFFDLCFGQRDGFSLKPDTTVVLDMIKALDATPDECIYLGDTQTDMLTGKNAGMTTIAVLWGFRSREELEPFSPEFIAEKPENIIEFVKTL